MMHFTPGLRKAEAAAVILVFAVSIFALQGHGVRDAFEDAGILGFVISGALYVYSLTSGVGTALLFIAADGIGNIFLAALIAGFGALIADLVLFGIVRTSLREEIEALSKSRFIHLIETQERRMIGKFARPLNTAIACLLIASPMPSEIGVSMLSADSKMKPALFALIAFALHTVGILAILALGRAV